YLDFSHALIQSERPADVQGSELAEYEQALKDEALPFQEKAIQLHEKNMEMMRAGVLNDWTQKSFHELAELMPARYAKSEESCGFLDAIDTYVYQSPLSKLTAPAPEEGKKHAKR